MEDNSGITVKDLYDKVIRIEQSLDRIMQALSIVTSANEVDRSSPFWDEEKQTYTLEKYKEEHPNDRTPKKKVKG